MTSGVFIERSQASDLRGRPLAGEALRVQTAHIQEAPLGGVGPLGAGQLPGPAPPPLTRAGSAAVLSPGPVPLAESVCPWAPTPSHCVSMGQAARSQLVPGAALQGLLQGPNHSVHVLPGGVTAQQADPQHLGRGRGGRRCQPLSAALPGCA